MNSSKYSSHRPAGREHVPIYPKGFIALRIVQLVLALIILGLCAYSLTTDLRFSGAALSLFTSVATLIIMGYLIVAHFGPAVIYNYYAVLALDITTVILWIASFALLAAQTAPVISTGIVWICDSDYCSWWYINEVGWAVAAGLCGAAGLGGIEFILSIVALAMHSVMMHRHRSAGLHNRPVSPQFGHHLSAFPTAGHVQAEKAQPTHNVVPQPQYASSMATPSPVQGQQMYQPPPAPTPNSVAQPAPCYPQQQQQSPLQPQHTGASHGVGQVPAPHVGSYQAQGQPVAHQQQYHPALGPN